jgi:hypothetical protein
MLDNGPILLIALVVVACALSLVLSVVRDPR